MIGLAVGLITGRRELVAAIVGAGIAVVVALATRFAWPSPNHALLRCVMITLPQADLPKTQESSGRPLNTTQPSERRRLRLGCQ